MGLFKVLLKLNVPEPVRVELVVVTPFHNTEIVILDPWDPMGALAH